MNFVLFEVIINQNEEDVCLTVFIKNSQRYINEKKIRRQRTEKKGWKTRKVNHSEAHLYRLKDYREYIEFRRKEKIKILLSISSSSSHVHSITIETEKRYIQFIRSTFKFIHVFLSLTINFSSTQKLFLRLISFSLYHTIITITFFNYNILKYLWEIFSLFLF